MPTHTKAKFISIRTLNQAMFDSHTKPSQFWSLNWGEVNSHSPHRNHVSFDHPYKNQVNFDTNTKTMSFPGRVALRVIHTSTCSCDTAAIRTIYLVITSTNSYYSWRFHTAVIPRKYCVILHHIIFLVHGIYTTWRILVAGLRYVPFLLYVILLGVIYRS